MVVWLVPKPAGLTNNINTEVEIFRKSHQCKPNLLVLSKRRRLVFRLVLPLWLQRGLGLQGCPCASLFMSPHPALKATSLVPCPAVAACWRYRPGLQAWRCWRFGRAFQQADTQSWERRHVEMPQSSPLLGCSRLTAMPPTDIGGPDLPRTCPSFYV